jgi:hypothetical protein
LPRHVPPPSADQRDAWAGALRSIYGTLHPDDADGAGDAIANPETSTNDLRLMCAEQLIAYRPEVQTYAVCSAAHPAPADDDDDGGAAAAEVAGSPTNELGAILSTVRAVQWRCGAVGFGGWVSAAERDSSPRCSHRLTHSRAPLFYTHPHLQAAELVAFPTWPLYDTLTGELTPAAEQVRRTASIVPWKGARAEQVATRFVLQAESF